MGSLSWLDETLGSINGAIERDGWTIVHACHPLTQQYWTYTIGLTAGFKHPELIIAGPEVALVGQALALLAFDIEAGARFGVGDTHHVGEMVVKFGAVASATWSSDLFTTWRDYYRTTGRRPRKRSALQVLWPDDRGRYPGDRAFDVRLISFQPLLAQDGARTV